MYTKLLPLLSDSLYELLTDMALENENLIAKEIIKAHDLIVVYNKTIQYEMLDNIDDARKSILQYIDSIITDEVRALSIRANIFEISFTPKGKELLYTSENTWSRTNRQTGKPARIIKKLLRQCYKNRDLEIFNNLLKSKIMNIGEFQIVSGTDITKYYNESIYFKANGTLGASCMRYSDCSPYFKLYEDCAQMLICIKNNRLLGRAILWTIDNIVYMDRVYVCDDYLEEQFISYAKEKKWIIRAHNGLVTSGDNATWLKPDDDYEKECYLDLKINLPTTYNKFPYVDSFRYYDSITKSIHTDPSIGDCRLDSTYGDFECCKYYYCDHCKKILKVWSNDDDDDEVVVYYSPSLNKFYCHECCTFDISTDDVRFLDDKLIDINTSHGIDSYSETYILQHLTNISTYTRKPAFIWHNNNYYHTSTLTWDIFKQQYIIDED